MDSNAQPESKSRKYAPWIGGVFIVAVIIGLAIYFTTEEEVEVIPVKAPVGAPTIGSTGSQSAGTGTGNGSPMITLYSGKKYTDVEVDEKIFDSDAPPGKRIVEPIILARGYASVLAAVVDGNYVFQWKSMKVEPGTKIMFKRDMGGGNTSRSFAVGKFNVTDLESWIRRFDRISGSGNWGYGSLSIKDLRQASPIFIYVLSDEAWLDAIKVEHAACMNLMNAWNQQSPGRYSEEDCKAISETTFKDAYTM